jgi:predicted nuclease of predicted toxin-antitoxin system
MKFMLDENVPASVTRMLEKHGHEVHRITAHVPPGSQDPLVATVSEQLDAVLVSHDGDFEKIAPRIPSGQRARFKKLSRVWLKCSEPQAASRLEGALDLIERELALAEARKDRRIHIWIANGFIRTNR